MRRAVQELLEESQRRGFIGPGPVGPHIDRALDMAALLPPSTSRVLDLGSGGGLPGLPLATAGQSLGLLDQPQWVLLDGSVTRARFLEDAVASLGLGATVTVVAERAERAARSELRGSFDVVVARSFGPPAVTAECASPFLRPGGRLIVAEPPGAREDRWPADGLAVLGMRPVVAVVHPSAFQVVEQVEPCPARFPRRVGIPAKRPLF